ncbi:MAG: metal-dependent hydrolase [Rickettsiales bacterium]|nr:metal-dependent hydrolase [Rickettsiales bacterium]
MDPFSHGFLASLAAQNISKKEHIKKASIYGFLAGMSPDLDVLIRSKTDSLLAVEFHRHFTHSIFFAPIGALIVSYFWWLIFRKNLQFKFAYPYSLIGILTHGLLDAATSYGTRIYWPFSNDRVSWSIISIIDPLFTIPLAILVILIAYKSTKFLKIFSIAFVFLYLFNGYLQRERVEETLENLSISRNHKIEHFEIKPTIGNNILWRSTYIYKDKIFIDAIRSNWLGDIKIYEGESLNHLSFPSSFSNLNKSSILYNDIARFDFFSNKFLGALEEMPNVIIDARYSISATSAKPMWGILIDEKHPNKHAYFKHFPREIDDKKITIFKKQLWGEDL